MVSARMSLMEQKQSGEEGNKDSRHKSETFDAVAL